MKAAIIAIGNEILIGRIQDTNSNWIAECLSELGIELQYIIDIKDVDTQIRDTLAYVEGKMDLVLITGGLGPTSDDITKHTLASYFDTELIFSSEVKDNIERIFKSFGRNKMSETNLSQAYVLKAATILPNSCGTAPGSWIERNGTVFVSMPGVPYEMKEMMTSQVIPAIKQRFVLPAILHKTVLTHGIPESDLADLIKEWEASLDKKLSLAYLPSPGIVRLRLSTSDNDRDAALSRIENAQSKLIPLLGDSVFGYDDDTIENVTGVLLKKAKACVATAESCTGGAVAAQIVSVSGASEYFAGGIIAYSNSVKTDILKVPQTMIEQYGAVSREVVIAMAQNSLNVMKADYAIAVSGVAGPGGGTENKPVGLVHIAVASKKRVVSEQFNFGKRRDSNIKRTVMSSLNMLRKMLIHDLS